jgi:glycosyltransferase involved in cell wall biosynthesis
MSARASSTDPLFTIAIPTFNRAGWLRRCVGSALSQTFSSFKVIVFDNASSDETKDVCSTTSPINGSRSSGNRAISARYGILEFRSLTCVACVISGAIEAVLGAPA